MTETPPSEISSEPFHQSLEIETRLAKKWFAPNQAQGNYGHSMPFLNRNLSYVLPVYGTCFNPFKRNWYAMKFSGAKKEGSGSILNLIVQQEQQEKLKDEGLSVRVVVDVENSTELVEILSDEDANKRRKDGVGGSKSTFYDPSVDGEPKRNRKAATLFFKSIRKSVKNELLKSNPETDENDQEFKYCLRRKMRQMWVALPKNESDMWKRREKQDKKRFQFQYAIYQRWNTSHKRAYFHFVSFSAGKTLATFGEARQNRKCPICHFDYREDKKLLMHCCGVHLTLSFEGAQDKHGNVSIVNYTLFKMFPFYFLFAFGF